MGNKQGGGLSCMATGQDVNAVGGAKFGIGSDIDAAVLAASNFGAGGLAQKLSLSFSCENLPNTDTFSLSDPCLVLFRLQGNVWVKIGQTEIIHDTLCPSFVTKITVDYYFEQQERFKVEVFDIDNDKQVNNLSLHDFLGSLEFQLHDVVTCLNQTFAKPLQNPKIPSAKGQIKIIAEEQT
jgi:hypothetical protein